MSTAKQAAQEWIDQLPDRVELEEIMYRLYVLNNIRKGREAVEQGKTLTSEELKQEMDSW